MKYFSLLVVVCTLSFSQISFAQNSHAFGIGLTTEKDQRIFLNYNTSTKHNFKLNFRLSQGWDIYEEHVESEKITTASNDLKSEEFWKKESIFQSKFFVGPEFQIKESNFSWGVEAVLGYRLDHYELTKNTHDLKYLSTDPVVMSMVYPAEKSERWVSKKEHFLTTGLNTRISLKAKATKNIGIRVFAELGLDYNLLVDDSLYEAEPVDPDPELPPGVIDITFPDNYFILRARLGASIYLFR